MRDDIYDLGAGEAFASLRIEGVGELRWQQVAGDEIEFELRARLLLFDWWIANGDRTLSPIGGNPNLLWSPSQKSLHLIDHNLAFDLEKMPPSFWDFASDHVFGADLMAEELLAEESSTASTPLSQPADRLRDFWQNNSHCIQESCDALPEKWAEAAPSFTQPNLKNFLDRIFGLELHRQQQH